MFDTRLRCCEFMYHKTAISKNTKTVLNMTKLILNKNKTNIQTSKQQQQQTRIRQKQRNAQTTNIFNKWFHDHLFCTLMPIFQGQFHLNNSICSHTCYFICTPGQPVTLLTLAIWRGSWQTSSIMSPGQPVILLTPAIWRSSWQTSSIMSPGQPVTLLTQKDQPSNGAADRLPALCHQANHLHYWPKKTSHLTGQLTDFQHYVTGPTSYTTDPKRPAIWRGSWQTSSIMSPGQPVTLLTPAIWRGSWQTSSIMSPGQPVTLLTPKDQPSDGAADRLPALWLTQQWLQHTANTHHDTDSHAVLMDQPFYLLVTTS